MCNIYFDVKKERVGDTPRLQNYKNIKYIIIVMTNESQERFFLIKVRDI